MLMMMMAVMLGSATVALANDEDEAACEGLALGDACIDHNDRSGTCIPDESEPNVLTCESDEDIGEDDTGNPGSDTSDTGSPGSDTSDTGVSSSTRSMSGGDADKAACATLAEGDACVDHNRRDGTCIPDESDPGVLTCESNEDLGSSSLSVACNAVGGTQAGWWIALLALAPLARRRRA